MTLLAFEVRGIPGAQGSKRHVGRGIMVESSTKVKPWRTDVKAAAEAALIATDCWETGHRGPVAIRLAFTFARPAGHYGTGRNARTVKASAPAYPTSRGLGDVDKLQRATFDALAAAGVIYDDSQITVVWASKAWGDTFGARIRVWSL